MKVICAPDSFKGSLSAASAAVHMAQGVQRTCSDVEVDVCPISDGGEGFIETIVGACDASYRIHTVAGPLGEPLEARWLWMNDDRQTTVIEMAEAAGLLRLNDDQRDPTRTTTYGVGQLIRAALHAGAKRILVGVGGSATHDGGCGMASALGARFFDHNEREISLPGPGLAPGVTPGLTGGQLTQIERIDLTQLEPKLCEVEIIIASDVANPLTGPDGAAHVYAPQKGAASKQVEQLDAGLAHLAKLWREQLNQDVEQAPGAGAAGGLGAGLMVFCRARMQSGVSLVLDLVGFDRRVAECDFCLTGEGRIDSQTLSGKAILGVAQAAAKRNVPTIALCGSLGGEVNGILAAGLHQVALIGEGLSEKESIARAGELVEQTAARITQQWSD